MTVTTDERYQEVEQATVSEAERRLTERYIRVYGKTEGLRRLNAMFDDMAANIRSDSRSAIPEDVAA